MGGSNLWASPNHFTLFYGSCSGRIGSFMPSRPFGGPEYVLQYLARYTHRVAISNHRLVSMADGNVTFRWKDYAHGNKKRKMTVTTDEFLRRLLLHVLPRGFVRIRHFGFLSARRRRESIAVSRQVLAEAPRPRSPTPTDNATARHHLAMPVLWRRHDHHGEAHR